MITSSINSKIIMCRVSFLGYIFWFTNQFTVVFPQVKPGLFSHSFQVESYVSTSQDLYVGDVVSTGNGSSLISWRGIQMELCLHYLLKLLYPCF